MSQPPQPVSPQNVGRNTQIIAGALIMGVLCFAVVALQTAQNNQVPFAILSIVAAVLAGVALPLSFIIPTYLVANQKPILAETTEPELSFRLARLYQTRVIVRMCLLDVVAFANLVAHTMEKQTWTWGVVAVLVACMAVSFPSQAQFEQWADEIRRDLS